ncbi:unnamed protein product [Lactuca virosa]|uniref:Thiamine pyrophosphate enzyme N-terminal TPP-binding domain-containing protein n=1 Tax=Lactuca virosa TaxID=75947 RepID=A0AAU9LT33_9ASTR|nr:unnamed protein product [Lactuca virosa]
MAICASHPTSISSKSPSFIPSFQSSTTILFFSLSSFSNNFRQQTRFPHMHIHTTTMSHRYQTRSAINQPRKGSDILVEALEREGVTHVFAYPGGSTIDIHQSLTHSSIIRTILPRHEQGGVFAAEGYARASGFPGVYIATSGPGATNLVTGIADAMHDSVPLVAITGQVPRKLMGTDAFQEAPIVELTCLITKHNYQVRNAKYIPRIVHKAFFLAKLGSTFCSKHSTLLMTW